jgi:hypothetical protein
MSNASNDLVRPSRDGDQFHYARAARLCLQLLRPATALEAVTIEGPSNHDDVHGGEDVIDLALYEGSIEPSKATRIAYRQFKHSTRHSGQPMTASGLLKTLEGFGDRFTSLVEQFGQELVLERFAFEFETNRPISQQVKDAVKHIADGLWHGTQTKEEKFLRAKLAPRIPDIQSFAKCL